MLEPMSACSMHFTSRVPYLKFQLKPKKENTLIHIHMHLHMLQMHIPIFCKNDASPEINASLQNLLQKHGSTDLHNRVFLTCTCQNASHFVIFQISNFVKRRRKVCRDIFSSGICSLCHTWTCCGDRSIRFFVWLGQFFFEMLPATINLLGSCNFRSSPHSHLPSPFTTHVDNGLQHHALLAVFSGDCLPTLTSICVNIYVIPHLPGEGC